MHRQDGGQMLSSYDLRDLNELKLQIAIKVLETVASVDCNGVLTLTTADPDWNPCGKCQGCLARAALRAIKEAEIP